MKKRGRKPTPTAYKFTARALNFDFKGWRENQKLTVGEASLILGVGWIHYNNMEKYGRAPMIGIIILARMLDYLGHMKKISPTAFHTWCQAMDEVEARSRVQLSNVEPARLVRAKEKCRLRQQQQAELGTTKASPESILEPKE